MEAVATTFRYIYISSDYVDTSGISTGDMEVSEVLFTFEYLYLVCFKACLFLCNGNKVMESPSCVFPSKTCIPIMK